MRLADDKSICSCCFQQRPDLAHVDFDAAWDGPVIDQANGMKQTIDDLVLCEQCLRSGAELLDDPRDDRMAELRRRVVDLEELLSKQTGYSAKLEDALQSKPKPAKPPARPRAKSRA